jgi:hypothetical protein
LFYLRDEVSKAGAGFKSLADIWSDEPNGEQARLFGTCLARGVDKEKAAGQGG